MSLRMLLDLVLPLECAGCRRPGARWCRRCDRALHRLAFPGGPRLVTPDPPPPGVPPVYAWGLYADPLKAAVTGWKDEGRRDLVAHLAPILAAALADAVPAALEATGGRAARPAVLVVPAPSSRASRRARGDIPLEGLARAATARLTPGAAELVPALDERRRVRDQAGLAAAARRDNVGGAFVVHPRLRPRVAGRPCVVVDDLMTTGATLVECARALAEAGAGVVVGATIAVPRRRSGRRPAPLGVGRPGDADTRGPGVRGSLPRGARAG